MNSNRAFTKCIIAIVVICVIRVQSTGTGGYASDGGLALKRLALGIRQRVEQQPHTRHSRKILDRAPSHRALEVLSRDEGRRDYVDLRRAVTFEKTAYKFTVPEDAPLGTIVGNVRATREQLGPNDASTTNELPRDTIQYAFDADTRSLHGGMLAIHPDTGEIFVRQNLDYERQELYVLYVDAYAIDIQTGEVQQPHHEDGAAAAAVAKVVVEVLDADDRPDIQVFTQGGKEHAELADGSEAGTFITYVSVHDADTGDAGRFFCRVDDPRFALVPQYDTMYMLVNRRRLRVDKDDKSTYKIGVVCRDNSLKPRASMAGLYVNIVSAVPVFNTEENNYRRSLANFFLELGRSKSKSTR